MQALIQLRSWPFLDPLASGWRWWIGELAAMVPKRLRSGYRSAPIASIYPSETCVEIDRLTGASGERFLETMGFASFTQDNWEELDAITRDCHTRMILRQPDILITHIELPKAARNKIGSAVELQLPQISPINPDLLTWTYGVHAITENSISVTIILARTTQIERFQSMFDEANLRVPPLYAESGDGLLALSKGEEQPRDPERARKRKAYVVALCLIMSVPLTTVVASTLIRMSLESEIATLEQDIAPKIEKEKQWRRANALRKAIAPITRLPSTSGAIDEIAKQLPMTAYAQQTAQGPDRSLTLIVNTTEPEVAAKSLSASPTLPDMMLVDVTNGNEPGRMVASFRTRPR